MIDIDTLRPDHMGCYGYTRDTTPSIDRIAAKGTRFDNYYCSDAPCLPSRAALVTGMFGIRNGAVGHGGTAADLRLEGAGRGFRDRISENNLHQIFRKAGMYTASVSTFAERHSAWWFNAGFNETVNVGGGGMESGEEVLPRALDWLDRNGKDDGWFLHVHLWDPHTPYRAPESFGDPFKDARFETWITEDIFNEHLKCVGPHTLNELSMYDDAVSPKYPRYPGKITEYGGLRRLIDGYDCGIAYADYLTGMIVGRLESLGVYDETAVIVTSDHGENFGELGIYAEHATADEGTCKIPMIIKWPGAKKGRADGSLHLNLDLAPTMAELLGVRPYAGWDGTSYAGFLLNSSDCGRGSAVVSQNAHVCQRAARFGDWLYIRTVHDGFHLFDKEMLYNVAADPHELCDLKDERPDMAARGAKIILDWQDEMMAKSNSDADPMWTVMREGGPEHTRGALNDYLARLEQTGRADGAARLKEKHGGGVKR